MPKGFFSQGVMVLLSEAVSIRKIEEMLNRRFEIVSIKETYEEWVFGGPSLLVPYRPEVNGYIQVDVVDRPWPDDMGDPSEEAMIFGAWSMGFFGPYTFPNNLERAAQQAWGYPEGRQACADHEAFIRIRSTYTFGQMDDQAPLLPEDYESLPELLAVTDIAGVLLQLPEALCYFNPSGECLASTEMFHELHERYEQTALPPLELWSNVRMFNIPSDENWLLMDSVGMLQLDVTDHEAIFHRHVYDPAEVANFLRNISNYVYESGPVIKNGDTTDGPGGVRWQGVLAEEGLAGPPREVIRWYPMDGRERPAMPE